MKEIIEMVVPENVNEAEFIVDLFDKAPSWVFVSEDLCQYLSDKFGGSRVGISLCTRMVIELGDSIIFIDYPNHNLFPGTWNQVTILCEGSEEDPEIIYFLDV